MKRLFPAFVALVAVAASGCAPTVDTAADKATIERLYPEWAKAAQERDWERWRSFWAEDAVALPAGAPMVSGKKAIEEYYSEHEFGDPNRIFHDLQQTYVEVARSGDLAYSMGVADSSFSDSEGKPVRAKGKWIKVWKKQGDGSWKCIINIWNRDQSELAPASE